MKKRIRVEGFSYNGGKKKVMLPKPIYIPSGYIGKDEFMQKLCVSLGKEWNKDNKELKKYKEFTDVICKYINYDFWYMNKKEKKIVEKMFKKHKEEKK